MDRVKWEISENVKKDYVVIAQDITDCNIGICNTDYKETEGGIKVHHCGTLTGRVTIHHPDCIVEVNETEVPL